MTHAPRLNSDKLFRLSRLLDMQYKPGEIASELGISVDTFTRSYIPAGAPVTVDLKGKIWVNGLAFATWARDYLASRKNKARGKMLPGEAFCFRCRKVIEIQKLKRKPANRYSCLVSGSCPVCGGKVARFDKGGEK